ncbi:MAG: HAD-IIB family hydrolase [Desulfobacterales bacterium]|nr:MAG: HAD-IIB family hydrolase [Desulfobacterales bacterium]
MIISQDVPSEAWKNEKASKGLFVTDFDGTLLRSDRTFAESDLKALNQLGKLHITRVIATGRSIFSFNTVADSGLPIDYVIFSTGAGVIHFPSGQIVRKVSLEESEVKRAFNLLIAAKLDVMIHRPIPENHKFAYYRANTKNSDFETRIALYKPYAFPMAQTTDGFGPATQLLAVLPPSQNIMIVSDIRKKLSDFNVIQTTSPLDGTSTWIEIFPANVSKSLTAAWLAKELDIDPDDTLALGNDYNDLDLLEWSATSFVVANAPDELKTRFAAVASNNKCGVAEAVERWLDRKAF